MPERHVYQAPMEPEVPTKCARCPFMDQEHDPLSSATHLYCQAPWWHPKHWTCPLPDGVTKA